MAEGVTHWQLVTEPQQTDLQHRGAAGLSAPFKSALVKLSFAICRPVLRKAPL